MSDAKPQDIVYEIIKSSRVQFRFPYITKTQILNEAKKTSLGEQNQEKYSGKKSKLLTQVDQAIRELHKNGKIIKKGHGRWSVNKFVKIKQIVCKHIEDKEDGRHWCPIKECYIGDPEQQCNVLFDTDVYTRLIKKFGDGIVHIRRCVGFTDKKSNAVRIEMSKKAVAVQEEREERDRRRNSNDIHDQESKKYLPKLHEQKED